MRLTVEERKQQQADCSKCGRTFKNVYAMSAHKHHCDIPKENRCPQFVATRNNAKGKLKYTLDEVLIEHSTASNGYVKKLLLAHNVCANECKECGLTTWRNKPITLELDHINGVSSDNRKINLRLLCPNCHSLTPAFRGRNKNLGRKTVSDEELLAALNSTPNIRQALLKVGMAAKGMNYERCKQLLKQRECFIWQ